MTAPFELIVAPFEVWSAPVGTAFPTLDEAPAGAWAKVGTSGKESITHAGVQVSHESAYTVAPFVLPGATAPSKASRTMELVSVAFMLADVTAEAYATALNGAVVTDVPPGSGTAGYRTVTLLNGPDVDEVALLIRGEVSPYIATGRSQYELPRVTQTAPPTPLFIKSEPAGLAFRLRALRDETLGYGVLRLQDAAAT